MYIVYSFPSYALQSIRLHRNLNFALIMHTMHGPRNNFRVSLTRTKLFDLFFFLSVDEEIEDQCCFAVRPRLAQH